MTNSCFPVDDKLNGQKPFRAIRLQALCQSCGQASNTLFLNRNEIEPFRPASALQHNRNDHGPL